MEVVDVLGVGGDGAHKILIVSEWKLTRTGGLQRLGLTWAPEEMLAALSLVSQNTSGSVRAEDRWDRDRAIPCVDCLRRIHDESSRR